jgi:class 3 adenylate cyclase
VEYSALIFSMLSLCLAIRTFVIEERPVLFFFPGLTTDVLHRIQYESIFAVCVLFTGFVYSLTHREFPWKAMKFFVWLSVVEFLIIFLAPVSFYTSLLIVFQLKVFAEAFYSFYIIGKSIRKKRKRAWIIFSLLTMIFISGINDVLYTNAVIRTGYQMQNVAFLILLAQAYIVATRISGAYYKFSNLSAALNEANLGLEQKVSQRTVELEKEKKKADDLLLNILPVKAAQDLKTKGKSQAQVFQNATVMLIDMVGFTKVSEQISAELLVAEIDECFRAFDDIMGIYGIEKIKTIGDAYLCAGGLPEPNDTHAEDIISAAIKINEYMALRFRDKELAGDVSFRIRTGIHSGPVVAGIVGIKKFSYDIWGNTVNITGEMEQLCHPGKINLSQATYELVKHRFACEHYGEIATGAEAIKMYYLEQPVADLV